MPNDNIIQKSIKPNFCNQNTITSILQFIRKRNYSKAISDRAEQMWRRVFKTSFYCHLTKGYKNYEVSYEIIFSLFNLVHFYPLRNYLRHEVDEESRLTECDDIIDKNIRRFQMLRSVLTGDLENSIITEQ